MARPTVGRFLTTAVSYSTSEQKGGEGRASECGSYDERRRSGGGRAGGVGLRNGRARGSRRP